jgi:manganese/zinc/iron transport system permease protein
MLGLSVLFGIIGAISGYWLANILDASIAGSMATMIGVIFVVVLLFAPDRGLIAIANRRRKQKWKFAQHMLIIHLLNHEGLPEEQQECRIEHMHEHMRWEPNFSSEVVQRAVKNDLIKRVNGCVRLTNNGRTIANEIVSQ